MNFGQAYLKLAVAMASSEIAISKYSQRINRSLFQKLGEKPYRVAFTSAPLIIGGYIETNLDCIEAFVK